jgi:hypothetical protein
LNQIILNVKPVGSSITIEGMALNIEATASSGSDIDAKDLLANEVSASIKRSNN